MPNLGNVYIWGSPFVMSRTDAQMRIMNKVYVEPPNRHFSDTVKSRNRNLALFYSLSKYNQRVRLL
jgi:hypothetical protein